LAEPTAQPRAAPFLHYDIHSLSFHAFLMLKLASGKRMFPKKKEPSCIDPNYLKNGPNVHNTLDTHIFDIFDVIFAPEEIEWPSHVA
jgi:hypothetical protein